MDRIEINKNRAESNVSLSEMRDRIRAEIAQELKTEQAADSAKIDELRTRIAAGTYEIDLCDLAKKLLFEVME